MAEIHRHDTQPSLSMARDPAGFSSNPRPEFLKPDDLRKELKTGQVGRALPLLSRIRDARDNQLITGSQAEDYLARLAALVHTETGDQLLERYPDPEQLKELFGQQYLGPEAVKKMWGVDVPPHLLPPQPFTDRVRQRAAELGQTLILRIDQTSDSSPLTMATMDVIRQRRTTSPWVISGTPLIEPKKYQGDDFFDKETPRFGWALINKGNVAPKMERNYLGQTIWAIDYLRKNIYQEGPLPSQLGDAIDEFEGYIDQRFRETSPAEISKLFEGPDWVRYAKELTALKITQLIRPSAADMLYDIATYQAVNREYLFRGLTHWTRTQLATGEVATVGVFDNRGIGVGVSGTQPGNSSGIHPRLAISLS